jgi:hypothetical protein
MKHEAMPEDIARRVWALRTLEAGHPGALWREEDRQWATQQALQALGASAVSDAPGAPDSSSPSSTARTTPTAAAPRPGHAAFHRARVQAAWPRLEQRLPALGPLLAATPLSWLAPPLLLAAFLAGAAIDHLGGGQRINLLAPPVWAVVLWNLVVYAALLWRALRRPAALSAPPARPASWVEALLARLPRWPAQPSTPAAPPAQAAQAAQALAELQAADLRLTQPLQALRLLRAVHLAAACLALGLVAGMYLRGLVLDYRAGWQSTFLGAAQVQAALDGLLAPASAATGVPVPAVAALQVAPEAAPTGPAAPWRTCAPAAPHEPCWCPMTTPSSPPWPPAPRPRRCTCSSWPLTKKHAPPCRACSGCCTARCHRGWCWKCWTIPPRWRCRHRRHAVRLPAGGSAGAMLKPPQRLRRGRRPGWPCVAAPKPCWC